MNRDEWAESGARGAGASGLMPFCETPLGLALPLGRVSTGAHEMGNGLLAATATITAHKHQKHHDA